MRQRENTSSNNKPGRKGSVHIKRSRPRRNATLPPRPNNKHVSEARRCDSAALPPSSKHTADPSAVRFTGQKCPRGGRFPRSAGPNGCFISPRGLKIHDLTRASLCLRFHLAAADRPGARSACARGMRPSKRVTVPQRDTPTRRIHPACLPACMIVSCT